MRFEKLLALRAHVAAGLVAVGLLLGSSVGTATAPDILPVIFVHGFCGNSETWDLMVPALASQIEGAGPQPAIRLYYNGNWVLQKNGSSADPVSPAQRFFTIDFYDPLAQTFDSIDVANRSVYDKAEELKQVIDFVKGKTGKPKVILVCHSLGGLVARLYVEDLATPRFAHDVGRLVTIDTPHQGADAADWLRNPVFDGYAALFNPCVASLTTNRTELEPSSPILQVLNTVNISTDVNVVSVASWKAAFPGNVSRQWLGDGIVYYYSQDLTNIPRYAATSNVRVMDNFVPGTLFSQIHTSVNNQASTIAIVRESILQASSQTLVSEPVRITRDGREITLAAVGDTLTVSFQLENKGPVSQLFDEVTAGGRLNGSVTCSNTFDGNCPDATHVMNLTIPSGGRYRYSQNVTLQETGRFRFFPAYRQGLWAPSVQGALGVQTSAEVQVSAPSVSDAAVLVSTTPLDGTQFLPGVGFTKTWTIKNSGTSTWNTAYRLRYVSGSLSTSRTERYISGTVAPGQSYPFSVPMRAPATPASYQEDWQFVSPGGHVIAVGSAQTIHSMISVVAATGGNRPTGYFESLTCQGGQGWAWDPDLPNSPITIQLREGPTVLQSFAAGEPRPDLTAYGNGQHAFSFLTPATLLSGTSRQVRAFAMSQGQETELFSSPRSITCSSTVADCSYVLSPAGARTSPASGGSDSVSVTTGASCTWRVRSDAPWLAVTGATDRSGSQWISYLTSMNPLTSRRVGTLVVEGNGKQTSLTITQDGALGNCSYSLSAVERNAMWIGNQDSITVQTSPGCTWTAAALDTWLTLIDGQGTGTGFLTWNSARNPDTSVRLGTIQVHGQSMTQSLLVRQDGYPTNWPHIDLATSVSTGKSLLASTAYQSVVIRNTGNAQLRITGLQQITGGAEFTGQVLETLIESGGSTSIAFAFSPSALGIRSAAFRLTSNDPDRGSVDITVTGEGVDRTTGGTDFLWADLPVTDISPSGFEFASAVAIGNLVYVVSDSGRLDRYDATVNLWTRLTDPPWGFWGGGGAAVINTRIYVISYSGEGRVQVYDPVSGTWSTGSRILTLRQGFSAAVANGKLYTFGGNGTGVVEEYDPATDSWRRRADMPTARDFSTAVSISNRIYVIGGSSSAGFHVAESYDPLSNTWTALESMPSDRRLATMVAVGPRIFVIGGLNLCGLSDCEAAVTTVEEFDTSLPDPHPFPGFQDVWFSRNPISHPRYGAAAVSVNGRIYVIGGRAGYTQGDLPVHVVEQGTFAADADVNVPVTSGDFGTVEVGRAAELAFEVQNRGSAVLTLTVRIAEGSSDVRRIESSVSVAAGASTRIHLRFYPSTVGSQTARCELATNDPDSRVISLGLSGSGIAPPSQDGGTWRVTRTVPVGGTARSLRSLAINSGKAYVINAVAGTLTIVDLASGAVDGSIVVTSASSFPNASLYQVAVLGGKAYVPLSNLGSDGRLAVADLASRTVQAYVNVGINPFGVVILGNSVFVSNMVTWTNGDPTTVRVVDALTNSVTKVITVGVSANRMAADSITGNVYVSNYGGSVSVIDAAQQQVIATVPLPFGPRGGPAGVAVSGPRAYVYTGPSVEILNLSNNVGVGSLVVEPNAGGMAANDRRVFLANSVNNTVTIIDPVANAIVAILAVPNMGEVAVDPDTGIAWVTRSDEASISAIEFVNTGFSLNCSPETSRLVPGDQTTISCSISSVGGFASTVDLSCAGAPAGAACMFTPTQVVLTANGSAQTTLTLSTSQTSLPGVYRITLTGTSGTVVQTAVTSLTVSSCDVLLPASSMSVPAAAAEASVDLQNANGCRWTVASQSAFLRITSPTSGVGSGLIAFHVDANPSGQPRTGILDIGGQAFAVTQTGTVSVSPSLFYPVPPCRVLDTRNPTGPLGAPSLQPGAARTFNPTASPCGIPPDAVAISANLTVTSVGASGELVVFPTDILQPNTTAISFRAGRTRANNAIVSFSKSGATFSVFNNSAATVDFILDVNGFFR